MESWSQPSCRTWKQHITGKPLSCSVSDTECAASASYTITSDLFLYFCTGQSSILGSVIDPLADKFLVFNLVISLTWVQLIPGMYDCVSDKFSSWAACGRGRGLRLGLLGFISVSVLPPGQKNWWKYSHAYKPSSWLSYLWGEKLSSSLSTSFGHAVYFSLCKTFQW